MRILKQTQLVAKGLTVLLLATVLAENAFATTINFDDAEGGSDISTTYAWQGVTFSNPLTPGAGVFARSSATNASPGNVVSVFLNGVPAFDARFGAVDATFSSGQRHVSIDAAILRLPEGLGTPTNGPMLEIYDMANAFVAAVQWDYSLIAQPSAGEITDFQTIEYTSLSNNIGMVRFMSGAPGQGPSNFGFFDNLVFTSESEPVSEPTSIALLGLALVAAGAASRRQKANDHS